MGVFEFIAAVLVGNVGEAGKRLKLLAETEACGINRHGKDSENQVGIGFL